MKLPNYYPGAYACVLKTECIPVCDISSACMCVHVYVLVSVTYSVCVCVCVCTYIVCMCIYAHVSFCVGR